MKASDVCVGDHCLFKFSGASVTPVTVVAPCEKYTDCFWVSPNNQEYRIQGAYTSEIDGEFVFASHAMYLQFIMRPGEDDVAQIDISTLI